MEDLGDGYGDGDDLNACFSVSSCRHKDVLLPLKKKRRVGMDVVHE